MVNTISVLGSTGSIGKQTLAVAKHLGIKVCALTANSSTDLLLQQVNEFKPSLVAINNEEAAKDFAKKTDVRVVSGIEGLIEASTMEETQCVVTAVSGSVGLKPTLAAINAKKRIALANKETLVCAGDVVMKTAKATGAEIVPVDSEHSAIYQCLMGRKDGELKKILLTGSGGPFRGKARSELKDVTPQMAVSHPNWSMGAKISVDSATLMNKGLEFIEAMHLFGVTPDDIKVVIHPQSVVHSMVELIDGTVIAQLGVPNMELPIQLALTYPERRESMFDGLDFYQMKDLTFEAPDYEKTPCLKLAIDCARTGGTAPCVMSAANEIAVHAFLREEIGFNDIYDLSLAAVEAIAPIYTDDLDEIIEQDLMAREFVKKKISK